MAEHAHARDDDAAPSMMRRHHFLLRRLHSLSGIVPVGVFVIFHLLTNAQMAWPDKGETFQHEVNFIHSIPALYLIEWALWASIGFHAGLGLYYTFTGKPNDNHYKFADNHRYTAQRVTGIIALVFIFLHIATLRWRWDIFGWFTPFYGEVEVDGHHVPMSMPLTAHALQQGWPVVALYLVGVLSVVFHWSNGLWTSAITWGVTITPASQRRWGFACAGLGVALTIFFAAAIVGALRYDLQNDPSPEQKAAMARIVPDYQADVPADALPGEHAPEAAPRTPELEQLEKLDESSGADARDGRGGLKLDRVNIPKH